MTGSAVAGGGGAAPGRLDVEAVRFAGEIAYARALEETGLVAALGERLATPDGERIRRTLMARSLRLTEGMAPEPYAAARCCAALFGIDRPIEIYQAAGEENAAMHLVDSPVLLEIRGRLLSLLDEPGLVSVMGHELGHYLAHGLWNPHQGAASLANGILAGGDAPPELLSLASRMSMAREITADRFGLMACKDLTAALRCEMVVTTGLSAGSLTWDTVAYLAQCRELMEATLAEGGTALGGTHPEHSLRAWALWLFSETDVYARWAGTGSGSRALAQVDELLLRVLGRDDVSVGTPAALEEPVRELHECALACCVLVALSDGELHDTEAEAIERVFATLVPDWRRYLDWDIACERFAETAVVVAAAGPSAQRSLLSLMVHVLGADGTVESLELDVVCAIGDALGCGPLFRRLLPLALRALGVEVPDLEGRKAPPIPMPARRDEAHAALAVFLEGVARRGGGEVTLRRLLRLLGERQASDQALATVRSALRRADLRCEPEPSDRLDEVLRLDPTPEASARRHGRPPAPVLGADQETLRRALLRLRESLVSGDGRSPAIRLRQARTGRAFDLHDLEAVSMGLSERALALVRGGKEARLVDAAEVGRHDGAKAVAQELIAMEREHKLRFEETGARDLYVGYPFLAGQAAGYLVRAPLVLYPVELVRSDRGARSFSLAPRRDEPPIANQSAIRLLFSKKGYALPDDLVERLDELAADGPEALLGELARLGVSPRVLTGQLGPLTDRLTELLAWAADRLDVEEVAVLGLFPQSSSDLLQDYDSLLAALAEGVHPGEALGCAAELLPADLRERVTGGAAPASARNEPLTPVLYADPSQRAVLARARSARALVVDGPPGTGKSQVIVNLVADAVARGERVAVVCEKRAALDVVVQRLEKVGLRHLLGLVHDVHDDRRGLYRQIAARLEEAADRTWDQAEAARLTQEADALGAALDLRSAALAHRAGALSVGELHTFASGLTVTGGGPLGATGGPRVVAPPAPPGVRQTGAVPLPTVAGLGRLDLREAESLAGHVAGLRPFADLFAAGSPWRAPDGERPSVAGWGADRIDAATRALEGALATARAWEAHRARIQQGLDGSHRAALVAVRDSRDARTDGAAREVFAAILAAGERSREHLEVVAAADATWAEVGDAVERVGARIAFDPGQELEAALPVASRWAGRLLRFFALSWWRAQSAIRRALAAHWPERAAQRVDGGLLAELRTRLAATRAWRALDAAAGVLGLRGMAGGLDGARELARRLGPALRRALPLLSHRALLLGAGAWPSPPSPDALDAWDREVDARIALLEAQEAHARASEPVRALLPWTPPLPSAEAVARALDAWRRDAWRLVDADSRVASARAVFDQAGSMVSLLADAGGDWAERVRLAWAEARIAEVERIAPHVRLLETPVPHGDEPAAAARLRALVDQIAARETDRLLANRDRTELLRAVAEPGKRRTTLQAAREAMLKDAKKQRNILPLRSYVRRFAGSGLLDVLPVWLLSPETLAVLFPREPLFDVVIIDEASQCTVEHGLPVLMRSRRVVVAGDDKQMPPTSFFQSQASEEPEPDDERREARDLLDAESLLVLARTRVERVGLRWHYRCLFEELIAFSNFSMYGGGLHTVPSTASPTSAPALRWVQVEGATYDRGANVVEARRIVDLVHELLARPARSTIGVVTFNLVQRRAILDEVDTRRATDADFRERWDEAAGRDLVDERPFVKNLESVQGDERDVIIFSLGHAPVERCRKDGRVDRTVPARFGPLGQKGGARRLNVAISRARRETWVVSSFEPSLLSVAKSLHDGPRLLKAFLEFAWHLAAGRRAQAERLLALVRDGESGTSTSSRRTLPGGYVPLEAQIALALQERGFACELNVGSSGFRVPLAVVDPKDPARYALGILCDDGEVAEPAFERHVHVPTVLDARGWRIVRVSAREWHRRRDDVLARLHAAIG